MSNQQPIICLQKHGPLSVRGCPNPTFYLWGKWVTRQISCQDAGDWCIFWSPSSLSGVAATWQQLGERFSRSIPAKQGTYFYWAMDYKLTNIVKSSKKAGVICSENTHTHIIYIYIYSNMKGMLFCLTIWMYSPYLFFVRITFKPFQAKKNRSNGTTSPMQEQNVDRGVPF